MKPLIPLRTALADPDLLGHALPGDSWKAWRVLLIAAMGEALTDAERVAFKQLTGREREPGQRVEELTAVIGRRGGKSRAMATLAVYIAGLCRHRLAPGERGVLLLIAPDQRQAAISLDYAVAALEQSPKMASLIVERTADTLQLTGGISIEVRAANFRRLRGPTYIAVIADESAFFFSDEYGGTNADVEILNACRPGLATTGGMMVVASSPYARRGVLHEVWRKHYGPDGDPLILVAQGASRVFNPSLPQRVVDRALERDRASATAEFLAEFRADIAAYIDYEVVQSCVGDHFEAAPLPGRRYAAFVDPSGGSSDSFTLAIGHRDGDRVVIDAVREQRPPFSPEAVIDDFATLLKTYRVTKVRGDHYGGLFPRELFGKRGVRYETADKAKSDLYRDLLPLLNSGRIMLPKSERLVSQLCGLERRTARSGKDSIDHGPGGHDDIANAVAGAADLLVSRRQLVISSAVLAAAGKPTAYTRLHGGLRHRRFRSA